MSKPLGRVSVYGRYDVNHPYVVAELRRADDTYVLGACKADVATARQELFELARKELQSRELDLAVLREFIASQEGR